MKAHGSSERDDFGFRRIELSRLELHHLYNYACDTVLDVRDCIRDACDGWMVQELRVLGVQVMVNVMLFDHYRKVLSVNHKF